MRFVFFLLLLNLLYSCSEKRVKPTINSNLNVEKLPDQESWNSTVFFSDSGNTEAVLKAGRIRVYYDTKETLLDSNIHIDFYNKDGKISSVLTAKKGKVNDATHDLYAMDSVVAVNDSGLTLKTEELMWRNKDRKIISNKFVTITSPKETIQGYGFQSNQDLRNYVIYNITYVTKPKPSAESNSQK
jgi:LPS export ABC transporter protein LptC